MVGLSLHSLYFEKSYDNYAGFILLFKVQRNSSKSNDISTYEQGAYFERFTPKTSQTIKQAVKRITLSTCKLY
jgi:hypothetical protein